MIIRSKYKDLYYNVDNNKIIIETKFNGDHFNTSKTSGKQFYDFKHYIKDKYNVTPNTYFKSEMHY